jgi:hypothetical protein
VSAKRETGPLYRNLHIPCAPIRNDHLKGDLPEWLLDLPEWLLNLPEWLLNLPEWLLNLPEWLLNLPEWLLNLPEYQVVHETFGCGYLTPATGSQGHLRYSSTLFLYRAEKGTAML